jgi:hypothetical protein
VYAEDLKQDKMAEFAPYAIRELMTAGSAPAGLATSLGSGSMMRVSAIESNQGDAFPNVVYSQLEEMLDSSKDGTVSSGFSLMVIVSARQPGAYIELKKIARLTRRAIDSKIVSANDEDDNTISLRLRFTGEEDLPVEPETNILQTALTFRAHKSN